MSGMIRTAHMGDLNDIIRIYNQAVSNKYATADLDPISANDKLGWFEAHDDERYSIYVYQEDDKILGWCAISPYREGRRALIDSAEISYYVDYDHHQQGIGGKLVEHAIEEAPRLGKRVLFGILLERNFVSRKLLENFGFDQWAYLPDVAEIGGERVSQVYLGKRL